MNRYIWIFLIAIVVISSCKKKESQADIDERLIQEYFSNNNIIDAKRIDAGVYYIIDTLGDGSGVYPNYVSTVRVHYKGYYLDGFEFAPGNFGDTPENFVLSQMIGGWQLGMPFFEKGASGRLFIPSFYGYGPSGTQNIPPNSVLIFEIELVNVY